MFRSINFRPALLWFSISFSIVFTLGVIASAFALSPVLQQKFESVHYRLLAMLPQPPHTEFVPTPLATLPASQFVGPVLNPTVEFVGPVLVPTATPRPTDAPVATATAMAAVSPTRLPTPTPAVAVRPVLAAVQLSGVTHDYQRWNNCGPTTLEMNLTFFGRHDTQAQIASALKPDPDDKNVSPAELTSYAQSDGLNSLVRINGTIDRIKLLLSNGLPVIVETGFDPPQAHEGWMGHYRLITGYNDKSFITQDSYDGPNVEVEFATLEGLWREFNRTYVLLYTKSQAPLVRVIIGADMEDAAMFAASTALARNEIASSPDDPFAEFNLGSSLVGLEKYDEAAAAYDRARVLGLPWRMLWYQFGPYEAYLNVGRYDELIALTNATLKPAPDLEESHYYKGLALERLGQAAQARSEFALALQYNKNYREAQQELALLAQQ
jgi:tetratricopeptide (TPR) repeat protein